MGVYLARLFVNHTLSIEASNRSEQQTTGSDSIDVVQEEVVIEPLREPTEDALAVYSHLSNSSLEEYQTILESFIRDSFPTSDSNETDPTSLINALRSHFVLDHGIHPSIPPHIWQTSKKRDEGDESLELARTSWTELNPYHNVTFANDSASDAWVNSRFSGNSSRVDVSSNDTSSELSGIRKVWNIIERPAILRSDFWRYLVLAVEGGVYADVDVSCLRPIDEWSLDPSWEGNLYVYMIPLECSPLFKSFTVFIYHSSLRPQGWHAPSLIVGIEADVGNREDWHEVGFSLSRIASSVSSHNADCMVPRQWYPRPLQIAQWTMASSRGHPVLIDTLRRISERILAFSPEDDLSLDSTLSVVEVTGPGVWTDAVLQYLLSKHGLRWYDLRALGEDGMRPNVGDEFGDVKVLSVTGFSPGIGQFGAGQTEDRAAMVLHAFRGSWKADEPADKVA